MSVYLCVCLSARISPELHVRSLPNFWCMLPTVVTRSSSGGWGEVCYLNTQVYGCHHTSDADTLQYSLSTATFRVRQTGQPSYLTMKLRNIVQLEYHVRLQLHYCSDHMLTRLSLHARSRLQHLLFGIHWILTLDLLKHS